MKKTTRFIALVCAILMMLCLCACGMSDVERLHNEDILRTFAHDVMSASTPTVDYVISYSKYGDLDIEVDAWSPKTSDPAMIAQIDTATREIMLMAEDWIREYAHLQNIEIDDVTVTCTGVNGGEYKSVNGNFIKTPTQALYED